MMLQKTIKSSQAFLSFYNGEIIQSALPMEQLNQLLLSSSVSSVMVKIMKCMEEINNKHQAFLMSLANYASFFGALFALLTELHGLQQCLKKIDMSVNKKDHEPDHEKDHKKESRKVLSKKEYQLHKVIQAGKSILMVLTKTALLFAIPIGIATITMPLFMASYSLNVLASSLSLVKSYHKYTAIKNDIKKPLLINSCFLPSPEKKQSSSVFDAPNAHENSYDYSHKLQRKIISKAINVCLSLVSLVAFSLFVGNIISLPLLTIAAGAVLVVANREALQQWKNKVYEDIETKVCGLKKYAFGFFEKTKFSTLSKASEVNHSSERELNGCTQTTSFFVP